MILACLLQYFNNDYKQITGSVKDFFDSLVFNNSIKDVYRSVSVKVTDHIDKWAAQ